MDFALGYNRQNWQNFLEDSFLPEDFSLKEKTINFEEKYSKKVTMLGECPSLKLNVFEVNHSSLNDARVGLSKEAFSLVRKYSNYNRALVLFVPENDINKYRFSYVEYTPKTDEAGKVTREITNPRRFSFILGKEAKTKTPKQYLIEKQRVKDEEDLKKRFSVEVLTKEFYNKLFDWYDKWAIEVVKFPIGTGKNVKLQKGQENRIHLIRLITRFIFVWFIKQKGLIPDWIFDKNEVSKVLTKFKSDSLTEGTYYNGIIQNLFFATLNKPIKEREFSKEKASERMEDYGIKTKFRDTINNSLFAITKEEFISKFESIPFLNGGLFECLDNFDTKEYIDGFSREKERQAFIPNALFWGKGEQTGLIDLFNTYNFTIEENTPQDIDVALDPELLGKAFENLLGTFNEETKSTARNESGSFYTPREIVDYMVDTSLKEYFKEKLKVKNNEIESKLDDLFSYNSEGNNFNSEETKLLMEAINNCKILDPACGSGAFPMGILNKLVFIMEKLDKDNSIWKQHQIEEATKKSNKAYGIDDKEKRNKRLKDIQDIFENSTGEYSNYARKLFLIENCIYGVDIQPIAIQISKLRFFISLIVDQKTGGSKDNNYHVLPLPNLETKFVAANTLIGVKREQGGLANPDIEVKQNELLDIRHKHFSARDAKEKIKLRNKDKELCKDLIKLLEDDRFLNSTDAEMLANWDPYNPSKSSDFFDPYWMYGLSNENTSSNSTSGCFDIVIGNPPYIDSEKMVNIGLEKERKYIINNYTYISGNWDIYMAFFEKGINLSTNILIYITPDKWLSKPFGFKFREHCMMPKMQNILHVGNKIFESVTVDGIISLFKRKSDILIVSEFDNFKNIKILNTFFKKDILSPFLIDYLFSNNIDIIKKIEDSSSHKLSDFSICENSCATSDAYKLIPLIKNIATFDENKYLLLINTGTIDKFINKWGAKEITYLGNKYMFPVVNRNKFLDSFGKTYINKTIRPKIIIKGLNLLDACIDLKGNTIPGKTTLVICNEDRNILKILSAIINSKLVIFYIKNKYSSSSYCGGITFTKDMINNLPIPKNIFQSSILEIVNLILDKKSKNPQSIITEYKNEINQILYSLLNLTDNEIKKIEEVNENKY